jgi:hypothetical protein
LSKSYQRNHPRPDEQEIASGKSPGTVRTTSTECSTCNFSASHFNFRSAPMNNHREKNKETEFHLVMTFFYNVLPLFSFSSPFFNIMSKTIQSIEDLFATLSAEDYAIALNKLLEKSVEHKYYSIPPRIPSPPAITSSLSVKRELNSPNTSHKGKIKKVSSLH